MLRSILLIAFTSAVVAASDVPLPCLPEIDDTISSCAEKMNTCGKERMIWADLCTDVSPPQCLCTMSCLEFKCEKQCIESPVCDWVEGTCQFALDEVEVFDVTGKCAFLEYEALVENAPNRTTEYETRKPTTSPTSLRP
jgi:hypothetical protein